MTPPAVDGLLIAVEGTGPQVHGDVGGLIAAQRGGENDPQKASLREQVVVHWMPGETVCLADLVERQHGSRDVILLRRLRRLTRR